MDILNAHLQFVTPFLKQHGVEYERDRFTEKLDAGDMSLDMTHLWLHRALRQLRVAAGYDIPTTTFENLSKFAPLQPASGPASCPQEKLFYRQLLSDLELKRGDAYLKLLRVAIVDNLLGTIVRVERKPGAQSTVAASSAGGGGGTKGGRQGGVVSTVDAAVANQDDQQAELLEVAVPETLTLDRYRLVVIAAGVEQVAYTACLLAFARQALAAARIPLVHADEERMQKALMVLFETEDVTSADICAQVRC